VRVTKQRGRRAHQANSGLTKAIKAMEKKETPASSKRNEQQLTLATVACLACGHWVGFLLVAVE